MLGEAFGAIAALEQESLAVGDAAERPLQVARLAGKNQRRKRRELLLNIGSRLPVRPDIPGTCRTGFLPPAIGRPTLSHGPCSWI